MSAVSKFARAVSLRDRGRSTSKTRTSEYGLFRLEDGRKKLSKDEINKVQEISTEFARLGKHGIPESRIEYALRARSAQGDVKEAMRLLGLYEDSMDGIIRTYNPNIKMLGAENREKTTCWLDSLLFAMFAKTDVFETVLHQQYEEEERRRLVEALRLWINMLRSGKLITVDITRHLQHAIAECGWPDAAKVRQQDASEAFNFITDSLKLPLLTLKTDIYHQGKEDANDDHKFITERMLDVAIPENLPQGEVLKLESCLEDYFNNRVEVKRLLARRNTVDSMEKNGASHVEVTEIELSRTNSPVPSEEVRKPPQRPLHMRARATSIFSERRLDAAIKNGDDKDSKDGTPASTAKKEVLMPAWQFLNLIPWYTDNVPEGDNQVRSHFSSKRLMLGICLKRYGMTQSGSSYRRSTHIDIPLEMASPHFTTGDELDVEGTDARNFKLVLKSFVCHRGHSVDAGHYIAFVRTELPASDPQGTFSEHSGEQIHNGSHDTWLRHDDLAGERVVTVDINKALKEESPYLLFYSVQPIVDDTPDETPPPYQESEEPLDYVDQKLAHLDAIGRSSLDPHSGRPSIEVTRVDNNSERNGERDSVLDSRRMSQVAPSSNGSLRVDQADQLPTEQSSPQISTRGPSPAVSRQPTRSIRSDNRPPSEDSSRRFSMSMPKLRLPSVSREKSNSDVVVKELPDESMPIPNTHNDLDEPLKTKEKKKKTKTLKRRPSRSNTLGKPDRECVIM